VPLLVLGLMRAMTPISGQQEAVYRGSFGDGFSFADSVHQKGRDRWSTHLVNGALTAPRIRLMLADGGPIAWASVTWCRPRDATGCWPPAGHAKAKRTCTIPKFRQQRLATV